MLDMIKGWASSFGFQIPKTTLINMKNLITITIQKRFFGDILQKLIIIRADITCFYSIKKAFQNYWRLSRKHGNSLGAIQKISTT